MIFPHVAGTVDGSWLDGVVAAVLTPFDRLGRPHPDRLAEYVGHLAGTGVSGLTVAAHTGRGQLVTPSAQAALVTAALEGGLPVVATASLPSGLRTSSRAAVERAYLESTELAAVAGASAVLCMPPPLSLDPDPTWVAHLHRQLAEATGLPVIAFVLYPGAAGTVTYGTEHLTALGDVPGVAAVKIATLDDAVACQEAIAHLREHAPHVRILTGEDRMFGPSLMWGATGALVGIGAANARLSVELVQAWHDRRLEDFVAASTRLDAFASLTFRAPIDGYVQRLAWAAAHEGLLPAELCHDPLATPATLAERDTFLRSLTELGAAQRLGARS